MHRNGAHRRSGALAHTIHRHSPCPRAYDALPDQPTLFRATERELAKANALRRSLRIHMYGTGVPAPVESAEDMAERHRLPAWLRHNVLEAGYHELTRVQMQAVPLLIGGCEVLADGLGRAPWSMHFVY